MNPRRYTFALPDCSDTVDERLLIQLLRTLAPGERMTVEAADDLDDPIPYLPVKAEGPASAANADRAQSDSTPGQESTTNGTETTR